MTRRRLGFVRAGIACLGLGLLTACVSVQVKPLTQQTFPPRPDSRPPEALREEPSRSHVKLAHIIATSENASEDTLRDRIVSRARQLGADAVVFGKVDIFESMGPNPPFHSTMPPASPSYTWGPWGWWTPFYLDPWSFVQGSADQTQRTLYVSGTAIRYDSATATGRN